MEEGIESEQISDSFCCSICLDLIYKPIVLACGHISCFWCVHISMSKLHESHCPICRHPYHHFPTICQMLHFLLLKMYPVTYKRRESHTLEYEKETLCFSPNVDNIVSSDELKTSGDPGQSSSTGSQVYLSVDHSFTRKGEACANPKQVEFSHFQVSGSANVEMLSPDAVEENELHQRSIHDTCKQVSVADMLCAACKQLLFRPIVLNCGHVYCEACVVIPANGTLKCQVCQSPHPRGFPKVCLELDHFLEEQFSSEYALRRGTLPKDVHAQNGSPTMKATEQGLHLVTRLADNGSNFHPGAGCDSCGMYPIIGDRYRCKDCKEKMGFDLCGDCYNTRSKLPGRFNQQHTPEHGFELVERLYMLMFRGQSGHFYITHSSDDENDLASPVTPADTIEDQSDNQSPI